MPDLPSRLAVLYRAVLYRQLLLYSIVGKTTMPVRCYLGKMGNDEGLTTPLSQLDA